MKSDRRESRMDNGQWIIDNALFCQLSEERQ